jgi:hypothetical protein
MRRAQEGRSASNEREPDTSTSDRRRQLSAKVASARRNADTSNQVLYTARHFAQSGEVPPLNPDRRDSFGRSLAGDSSSNSVPTTTSSSNSDDSRHVHSSSNSRAAVGAHSSTSSSLVVGGVEDLRYATALSSPDTHQPHSSSSSSSSLPPSSSLPSSSSSLPPSSSLPSSSSSSETSTTSSSSLSSGTSLLSQITSSREHVNHSTTILF